jgi:tetratricopeptide (TPR) repeat protein
LEANREKDLARRLSSVFAEWDKRPAAESVTTGLERVKDDSALPAARYADLAQAAGRNQEELAAFHVTRGRRLYEQEMDGDATAELNRALFLSPYHPEGNLLLGRVHQRSGRLAEAIGSFKIALWSAESAVAHAALASAYLDAKDLESARAEAARAIEMNPRSAEAKSMMERLTRADR